MKGIARKGVMNSKTQKAGRKTPKCVHFLKIGSEEFKSVSPLEALDVETFHISPCFHALAIAVPGLCGLFWLVERYKLLKSILN